MFFRDRQDAGRQLAEALLGHDNAIVLGLPRGGVVCASEVARALNLPLDVTCPRKIGHPLNPEYAIGAVTETGEGLFNPNEPYQEELVNQSAEEARVRLKLYRKGRPPRDVEGKEIILVDDGLATGFTMKAAIASIRKENPKKVVVAVPVAPPAAVEEIGEMADEVVCLHVPSSFMAIGQFYQEFDQTSDEEVIALMEQASGETSQ